MVKPVFKRAWRILLRQAFLFQVSIHLRIHYLNCWKSFGAAKCIAAKNHSISIAI